MRRLIIIVLTLALASHLFAQGKLERLTYSIVDTSETKTLQARDIYTWIINNISYDTKQMKNGLKSYTPEQIIKCRKAVCSGYSILFQSMCDILGIESYVVSGYCKGFNYSKGDHFIKADHTWNIIYADSNWLFVDPTWGSGHLEYTYTFKTKLKQRLSKNDGIKTKIIFIKDPNYQYFDTSFTNFASTHFPLDSKWQFLDYPVSYESFVKDSIVKSAFLNYKWEISLIRNKGGEYQSFIDGINSIKYNSYDRFDIAYQYYCQANQLKIKEKTLLDSALLKKLYESVEYYDSSSTYIRGFKTINNDLYKAKKNYQKNSYKSGKTSLTQVAKIPNKYNNHYSRVFYKLLNADTRLNKALRNVISIKSSLPDTIQYFFKVPLFFDFLVYYEGLKKAEKDRSNVEKDFILLDSLMRITDITIDACINKNDSILKVMDEISYFIHNIKFSMNRMDEFQVFKFCIKLNSCYKIYNKELSSKNYLQKQLTQNYRLIEDKYGKIERSFYSILNSYKKLAEVTGLNVKFSFDANEIMDSLRELYAQRVDFISSFQKNNIKWEELLDKQNEILSVFGSDGISIINKNLLLFYNFTSKKNNKVYLSNSKLYEEIKNGIAKNKLLYKKMLRTDRKHSFNKNKNTEERLY